MIFSETSSFPLKDKGLEASIIQNSVEDPFIRHVPQLAALREYNGIPCLLNVSNKQGTMDLYKVASMRYQNTFMVENENEHVILGMWLAENNLPVGYFDVELPSKPHALPVYHSCPLLENGTSIPTEFRQFLELKKALHTGDEYAAYIAKEFRGADLGTLNHTLMLALLQDMNFATYRVPDDITTDHPSNHYNILADTNSFYFQYEIPDSLVEKRKKYEGSTTLTSYQINLLMNALT